MEPRAHAVNMLMDALVYDPRVPAGVRLTSSHTRATPPNPPAMSLMGLSCSQRLQLWKQTEHLGLRRVTGEAGGGVLKSTREKKRRGRKKNPEKTQKN